MKANKKKQFQLYRKVRFQLNYFRKQAPQQRREMAPSSNGTSYKIAGALSRLDHEEELEIGEFLRHSSEEVDLKIVRAITRAQTATHDATANAPQFKQQQ